MMNFWHDIIPLVWLSAIAIIAGLIGHFVVFRLLMKIALRTRTKFDESFIKHCFTPSLWAIILLIYRWFLPLTAPENYIEAVTRFLSIVFVIIISWLLIKLTYILDDYVFDKFAIDTKDNLKARKIRTQLGVLKRIVIVIVLIVAIGSMLMSFEKVRQLGGAILASAGIIGIVVGIAAQKTIGTFIAGLQIAFSQPIRIDDVVIVENEWGRIEEITLTYVVIKIWDLRRLVVPITYFIEKPFQNWTRVTSDILGTVFIYVDYTVPIEEIRKQLHTILQSSKLWDGKVSVLQVTNTTEKTIELRALMSAEDASTAWGLRCYVREKLIEFIRSNYPESLPRFRASVEKTENQ
ncbi:MAG: mechanosensitive ion channel family protein [Planctomycetes bacterium]|nr:mechanosensitive ion channel family protein [Planctomycetota bacterium]MBU1517734.1 mechanosensitive ion channel family protein [Planctomycetota bacterium]MBU2457850.1 mechanosensitive ion channel family protein [Planctomycetota bacterium]MBU2597296.1 mechanosensitive ion channel family protein [Planctomycetota bacterium]